MSHAVWSRRAAIATEEPHASTVAADIIRRGGNAVDAAIAASLALAVTIPHLGGLGGDFFALVKDPKGSVYFINGSGYSPEGLEAEVGHQLRGPEAITVPGMVAGLHRLWRMLGSLEWAELVEPALKLARDGFPASSTLAEGIRAAEDRLARDPGSRETYLAARVVEGSVIKFPGLARALELIAEDPRSFYEGDIAEAIAEYASSRGSAISISDLRSYDAEEGAPLRTTYRGWVVYEMPPNTQGVTALHILKLLEGLEPPNDPFGVERVRAVLEAAAPAYMWRDLNLGDPRYMKVPVDRLLSDEVLDEVRRMRGVPRVGGAGDTTYFAIATADGYVVSAIQSLYHPFGSGVTEPRYQITLNDRGSCFDPRPGLPNSVGPRKKPLHTLSAIIMGDGTNWYALGASGGHLRPQQHAVFVTNIVDYGMRFDEAINAPRFAWNPETGELLVEEGIKAPELPWVKRIKRVRRVGVANAAALLTGSVGASTDRRGAGAPAIVAW